MIFEATEQQIRQIAANAVNASSPLGMGFLHFKVKDYKPEEIDLQFDQFGFTLSKSAFVDLDYYQGRMVKLRIRKVENTENRWMVNGEPRGDYQSWAAKYPSNRALVESAGAKVIEL